jgi:hypothetical protein
MPPLGPDDPTPPMGVPAIREEAPTRPELLVRCPECVGRGPCALCRGAGEVTPAQLARWHARREGRPSPDEE